MTWARRYALRNIAFSFAKTASEYGSGNYGDGTYGQEASDVLSNTDYVLSAEPGEYPSRTGWVYRVGDVGVTFSAVVLGLDGPLDLAPVASAALIIERTTPVTSAVIKAFPLTVNDTDDILTYDFVVGDLDDQGTYRAAVQLVFDSGRCMTVTPDDATTFMIRGE